LRGPVKMGNLLIHMSCIMIICSTNINDKRENIGKKTD